MNDSTPNEFATQCQQLILTSGLATQQALSDTKAAIAEILKEAVKTSSQAAREEIFAATSRSPEKADMSPFHHLFSSSASYYGESSTIRVGSVEIILIILVLGILLAGFFWIVTSRARAIILDVARM